VREKTVGLVQTEDVLAVAAQPRAQQVIEIDDDDNETSSTRERELEIDDLRLRLWEIFENEGKTLAALNASLFAADLSDQVGVRMLHARREIGDRLVRTYCVAKGVAVAFNPIPVADLFAAAFIDVGMVVHLSKVYDLPISRREAGSLVSVIAAEAAALMGTVWALNIVSSALKVGTAGLSTIVTAGAQGAIAYYSTYVVGRIAAEYLSKGKSWGEGGPKQVVNEILDSLDRDTVLQEAKKEIRARLGR
jgi:GTP-binding protein Era